MKWSQEMVNHSIVIWKREHMYDCESAKSDDYAVITGPTLVQFDELISVYYHVRQTSYFVVTVHIWGDTATSDTHHQGNLAHVEVVIICEWRFDTGRSVLAGRDAPTLPRWCRLSGQRFYKGALGVLPHGLLYDGFLHWHGLELVSLLLELELLPLLLHLWS